MNEEDYEITDPASEIATLFLSFSNIDADNSTTLAALSWHFECDPAGSEWYELLGAMASRLTSLRKFIEDVDDKYVKERMRSSTLSSLDHMTKFLQPSQMNRQWNSVKAELFSDEHISRLESFAAVAEKYRPLRKLDDEKRQELIDKLDELLLDEEAFLKDMPLWVEAPLREGLARLRHVLNHFHFFGHEAAIDALVNLSGKLEAVACSELPDHQKKSIFQLLRNTMHVVFFVGEVLLLPANVYQGYHVYKDIALEHVIGKKDQTLALINEKSDQKALSGPETVAP